MPITAWKPWKWIFGRGLTPEQMLRKNQQALNRAMRNIDRERVRMEREEKKLIIDIKKMAKDNHNDAVIIIAKDIAQTRRYIKKFMLMRANIQAVSMRITSLRSQNAITEALTEITMTMRKMNRELKIPVIQNILREFEKQSTLMEMKEEMMGEAIDDAMGEADDEEESDTIVSQIFDELGLQLSDQLYGLPETQGKLKDANKSSLKTGISNAVNDESQIEERLANLRRVDFPDFPSPKPKNP